MKIGKLELETFVPNAERLLSSTGCSVAEMHRMLSGPSSSSIVARALHACIADSIAIHDLAVVIAKAGVDGVRRAVAELYKPAEEPPHDGAE